MPPLSTATCLNCKRPIFSSFLKVTDVHLKVTDVGLTLLLLLECKVTKCLYNLYALLQLTKVKLMILTSPFLNKHK